MPNWKRVITSGSDASLNSLEIATDLTISGALYDNNGLTGTSGQVLTSTVTGLEWADSTGGTGGSSETARDLVISGKNVTGTTIPKGMPLYFTASGVSGNVVGVMPADAGNPDRMPAGGVAAEELTAGSEGSVYIYGFINGVDTSAFGSGDDVYVAVGGGYTNEKPTGSALIQKLGNVEKVDATNGSGVIQGPSWFNDLPNWEEGKIKVGVSDGQPVTSSFIHLDESGETIMFSDYAKIGVKEVDSNDYLDFSLYTLPTAPLQPATYSTKLRVGSSGVGIGTTPLAADLHLNSFSAGGFSLIDTVFKIQNSNTIFDIIVSDLDSNFYISDDSGFNKFLTISDIGNVGIGTTTPSQKLDVVGKIALNDGGNSVFVGTNAGLNDDASGNGNVGVGYEALRTNTTGYHNTATGLQALYSNTTGYQNTANGYLALYSNTTGTENTATGYTALYLNTTGNRNTANGFQALRTNTTGERNTANGNRALYSNATGGSNTATGYTALFSNTTGNSNTATGYSALFSNTTGYHNIATGYRALFSNTIGFQNTAHGYEALFNNTTGNENTATGYTALYSNTTGNRNTANGYQALRSNTTGNYNTVTGYQALYSNTTGNNNTATGVEALRNNTEGYRNTAIGASALEYNTTGYHNTANGYQALYYNDSGIGNTSTGYGASILNISGDYNTVFGFEALYYSETGNNNVANGGLAGKFTSTGAETILSDNSIFIGYDARPNANSQTNQIVIGYEGRGLGNNTAVLGNSSIVTTRLHGNVGIGTDVPSAELDVVGKIDLNDGGNSVFVGTNAGLNDDASDNRNVGVGYRALYNNETGYENTANGYGALYNNTTGYRNTANGSQVLYNNTTGNRNAANGSQVLYSNTDGDLNTAVGYAALYNNTTANNNTANGAYALQLNTTGNNNTANGYQAGRYTNAGANVTVTNNSVFIGYDARPNADSQTNQIVIGSEARGLGSNTVVIGNTSITKTRLQGNVGIGTDTPANTLDVNGGIDATTLNTGQGDNELYAMNQNVQTTDSPTFSNLYVGSSGNTSTSLDIIATNTAGAPAATAVITMTGYEGRAIGTFFKDVSYSGQEWFSGLIYNGAFSTFQIGYDATGGQAEYSTNSVLQITKTGEATFLGGVNSTFLNTGQGDNELYAMNQNVQTTDSPTFSRLILSQTTGTAPLTVSSTTVVTNLNADLLDGQHGSYYQPASTALTTSTSFGGDVSGTYNNIVVANDSHTHDGRYYTETESDARYLGISAKAADSNLLDGIDSSQFLRSDTNDNTSGYLGAEGFVGLGGNRLRLSLPHGADYGVNGGATGVIKITLPQSWSSTMMRMTIKIYEYGNHESFEVSCGGYNYSAGNWINTYAYITSDPEIDRDFTVRFGHDGSNCAIYIGETTSTWSYPQIFVTDFQAGFSNFTAEQWNDGWSVDIVSTLGTITSTHTKTQIGKYVSGNTIWHSGNDGAGSGLDADLWDGNQFSSYLNQAVLTTSSPTFAGLNLGSGNLNTVENIYLDNAIFSQGDTDTYIQFHSGDQFRVVTGGAERLEVNNSDVRLSRNLNMQNYSLLNTEDIYLNDRIYHDGDTDTYMQFHAADQWRVVTGGGERIEANSSGLLVTGQISTGIGYTELYLMNQNVRTTDSVTFGNITNSGVYTANSTSTRDKIRVWSSSAHTIGMQAGHTFGALNDYAMTFQMNDDSDRGFWWGDSSHTTSQGAMSLTTIGELTLAKSVRVGWGESDTVTATSPLEVYGSGGTVMSVDGSTGRLFELTDSMDGSLFSVNDVSGLPILEVFSDNSINMGTYGSEELKVSTGQISVTGNSFFSDSLHLANGKHIRVKRADTGVYHDIFSFDGNDDVVVNRGSLVGHGSSGLFFGVGSSNAFQIRNSSNVRMFTIDESTGNAAIGVGSNPTTADKLFVDGAVRIDGQSTSDTLLDLRNSAGTQIGKFVADSSNHGQFSIFNSSGLENIIINQNVYWHKSENQFYPQMRIENYGNNANAGYVNFRKIRGTTGVPLAVQDGDVLGTFIGQGWNTNFHNAAFFQFAVDGTPTTSYVPGSISFSTTNDSGVASTKMHIASDGNMGVGTTSPTGKFHVYGNFSSTVASRFENGGNTSNSHAVVDIRVNSSDADPRLQYTIAGEGTWYAGADNSNSNVYCVSWQDASMATADFKISTTGTTTVTRIEGESGLHVPVISKTAAYTLASGDEGGYIRVNSASAVNVTVPTNASVAFAVGTVITISQTGAGQITAVGASGVTLNGDKKTAGQYKSLQVLKVGTDVWDVIGGVP